eukprot:9916936-Karenia_brevis.AAC.1
MTCQFQLLVRGDNLAVIRWLQGQWNAKYFPYASRVRAAIAHLEGLHRNFAIMPQDAHLDVFEHVPRELNERADGLSKLLAEGEQMQYWLECKTPILKCLRIHFDGSFDKASGKGAAAWILDTSMNGTDWHTIAWQTVQVAGGLSSTATELSSARNAIAFLDQLIRWPQSTRRWLESQQADSYE